MSRNIFRLRWAHLQRGFQSSQTIGREQGTTLRFSPGFLIIPTALYRVIIAGVFGGWLRERK